jgi:hypothetical protein
MIRFAFIATMLFASPVLAGDETFSFATDEFSMPSGNVKCYHGVTEEGNGVYCLRFEPYLISVRFADGIVDVGDASGDQPSFDRIKTFAYGKVKTYDDMTCWSRTAGLECKAGSKGFQLSRKGVKVFNCWRTHDPSYSGFECRVVVSQICSF